MRGDVGIAPYKSVCKQNNKLQFDICLQKKDAVFPCADKTVI